MLLGAQRLVSPLDWANTRRTFDGYRLTHSSGSNDLDVFYTNPVSRVFATAGTNEWDSSDSRQHFYGLYNSFKGLEAGTLDAYYLAYDNDNTNFSFHTLGSRLAGKSDSFLYEFEGGVQFGQNSNGSDHSAGFVTAGLGKLLTIADSWKPTIWAWYDLAAEAGKQFDRTYEAYFEIQRAMAADQSPPPFSLNTLIDGLHRLEMLAEVPDEVQRNCAEARRAATRIDGSLERAREAYRGVSHAMLRAATVGRGPKTAVSLTHYYCPMVPGGGGDWMQPGGALRNPYWGSEMLTCGEVVRDMAIADAEIASFGRTAQ